MNRRNHSGTNRGMHTMSRSAGLAGTVLLAFAVLASGCGRTRESRLRRRQEVAGCAEAAEAARPRSFR